MTSDEIGKGRKMIIGGDWNIMHNLKLDKKGGLSVERKSVNNILHNLFNELDLIDEWRIRNPHKQRYTWRQKKPIIQCVWTIT